MRNILFRTTVLAVLGTFAVLAAAPALGADTILESGVPLNSSLAGKTIAADAYVVVPDGATRLTVAITNGSGDLDLYVKYGSPVTGSTIAQFDADTDFISDGVTANETIVVTPSSKPPLRPGRWYVATLNLNDTTTTFTVTATVDVPVSATKHEVSVVANPDVNTPGASFTCSYQITKGTAEGPVDLYAALQIPGGALAFFSPAGLSTEPVPVRSGMTPADGSGTILPRLTLPGKIPAGSYIFYAVLVKSGADVMETGNWQSNLEVRTMHFALLSPVQQAFIDSMGYPQQFVKFFSEKAGVRRVDETWGFIGHGLGENFIDGVFVDEQAFAESLPGAPAGILRPEIYTYDTTFADVVARHGQPLETKKDAIGDGQYKTYLYDGFVFGFLNGELLSVIAGK